MNTFIKRLLIFFIFLLLILGYLHPITAITQDLGRHLLTGEIILQTHHVPNENLFSYTFPRFSFINHHWFSEVIFYLVQKIFGFPGLSFVTIVTILATFTLLFAYSYKRSNIIAIVCTSLLYIPILFERTDIRPEIFSFLFLAIFVVILYRCKERFTKWIYVLIPIELIWVNMHIYFFVGIAVVGMFVVDEIISMKFQRKQTLCSFSKQRTLLVVFILCIVVTLFNPNGFKGAVYPLQVFQNYGYAIEENQNIFFINQLSPHITIYFFLISIVLLVVLLSISFKQTKPIDWMLAIFFSIFGAVAIRNLPLFVIATFIPFSYHVLRFLTSLRGVRHLANDAASGKLVPLGYAAIPSSLARVTNNEIASPPIESGVRKDVRVFGYSLLVVFLIWEMVVTIQKNSVGFTVVSGARPAADFFLRNKLKGPIFNNFDIGSYIEYRFYPEKVFIDGRPEAYPAAFIQDVYMPMQTDKEIFSLVDNKYHFNTIFFSYIDQTPWASKFVSLIMKNPNWQLVYIDDFIMILVKNNSKNERLIEQFRIGEKTVNRDFDKENLENLMHYAYFFNKIGWSKQEEKVYNAMLSRDERNCTALYNIAILYIRENNPAKNIYQQKAQTFCPQYF